jgi:hypothetical protein
MSLAKFLAADEAVECTLNQLLGCTKKSQWRFDSSNACVRLPLNRIECGRDLGKEWVKTVPIMCEKAHSTRNLEDGRVH